MAFVNASDVSLSGTVKDMDGKPIDNATVTTTTLQNQDSTRTDSLGHFALNSVSVRHMTAKNSSHQFTIKNNTLLFSSSAGPMSGKLEIYSASGKRFFSKPFTNTTTGKGILIPREMASGIYIFKLTINHNVFTWNSLFDGNIICSPGSLKANTIQDNSSLGKIADIVDTLIVIKKNFIDFKLPLDSYTKTNLSISISGGVLRNKFQISNTMIPGWKMAHSTIDSSFVLWSASRLTDDIDGGAVRYTTLGMLQAADISMIGPNNSEGNPNILTNNSFVMDFGNETNAKKIYAHQKDQFFDEQALSITGYGDSVAFAKSSLSGITLYSYYKQFYFELIFDQYIENDQAVADGKKFLDYFISKAN
jgi:hypothetical protein